MTAVYEKKVVLEAPRLSEAGIPRKAWKLSLKNLPSTLRETCRRYTVKMLEYRDDGNGLLFFGSDSDNRYVAYHSVMKAALAQGFTVKCFTLDSLTAAYFNNRKGLADELASVDFVGVYEMNVPRDIVNAGMRHALLHCVQSRRDAGLPFIAGTSLEVDGVEDGLSTRYPGIEMIDNMTLVVVTDEDPVQSRWLKERKKL